MAAPDSRLCIAVSSAGRRVGLVRAFRDDATRLGIDLEILAFDVAPQLSAACQVADRAFEVPRCSDEAFIAVLKAICHDHGVRLLIPTIDPELMPLSCARAQFEAMGTNVVVPGLEVVEVTDDKLLTAQRLEAAGIPAPKSVTLDQYLRDPASIPGQVIAKPRKGSASIGIVRSDGPTAFAGLDPETYLVQECWSGREYTINCYFQSGGVLVAAVPHQRIEVRGGEVSKGRTERVPALLESARRLSAALPDVVGPLCFQAMVQPSGQSAVFEINARFGGGYPLAHRAGARFSQWLLEEAAGLPSSAGDDWRANVLMLRFDEAVYLNG